MVTDVAARRARATGTVLLTLCAAQFLMTLDTSVMNVAIATVAQDVGSSVTGIQSAITFYTLVMASLMITGSKIGQLIGRKKAFTVGCLIYGTGSLITALAPNLAVLMLGWSVLEGVGAALILPAIVALVATNFGRPERPRAYGLVAASGAIAVAAGPLIGGVLTTYASWRWVFAGEVLLVIAILLLARKVADEPLEVAGGLDLIGTLLSASGLALVVLGILRGGAWGFVLPKPGGPSWLGMSPSIWLLLAGGVVIRAFQLWVRHRVRLGRPTLVQPGMLANRLLRGGLTSFGFQYLLQAGLFFIVPLYLSVALGLSAVETGLRILPLSVTLLLGAVGVPKVFPNVSPRRVVRIGFLALFAGVVTLFALLDLGAGPQIVTWPLLLAGLGIGALASQLGSVTVSAVPDEQSTDVGGLQNTVTNLGASVGTALAGAILISALTSSFLAGVSDNPAVPDDVAAQADVELTGGVPFISDAQLEAALSRTDVDDQATAAILADNQESRIKALRSALAVLALLSIAAVLVTDAIPTRQPGAPPEREPAEPARHRAPARPKPAPHPGGVPR